MKACYYESWGKVDKVLKMGELPKPTLEGPHDVLVKVHCASINPADYKHCEGELRPLLSRPFPIKPGFDFSGVIVEKGEQVSDRLNVGDEVFGMIRGLRTGTTSEFIQVNEAVVSRKPASVSFQHCAGLPLAATTAFQCLEKGLPFPPNEESASKSVFCTGGPGGVGTFVIQLAKQMFKVGRVVCTASPGDKTDLCKELGADHVVNYRSENFWECLGEEKFDVCVDCTGESAKMAKIVKENGVISTIISSITKDMLTEWVNHMGPNPGARLYGPVKAGLSFLPAPVLGLFSGAMNVTMRLPHGAKFYSLITLPKYEVQDEIIKLVVDGKVRVVVDQVFPLDQAVDAYKRSASGKAVGKVLVEVIKD